MSSTLIATRTDPIQPPTASQWSFLVSTFGQPSPRVLTLCVSWTGQPMSRLPEWGGGDVPLRSARQDGANSYAAFQLVNAGDFSNSATFTHRVTDPESSIDLHYAQAYVSSTVAEANALCPEAAAPVVPAMPWAMAAVMVVGLLEVGRRAWTQSTR